MILGNQSSPESVEVPLYHASVPPRSQSAESVVSCDSVEGYLPSEATQITEDDASLHFPPKDTGWPPWRFLLGTWLVESVLWGFPLAFGIFQSHYSQHELFSKQAQLIPTIGTVAAGLSYLGVPFINPLVQRIPKYHRHVTVLGWAMCLLGLVGASFAASVWHLVLTQGVLYGLGWVVCYVPFLIMLNDWFDERRGLAYGILFGASGISGLVIPFFLEAMLNRFGFRATLRAYAAVALVVSLPGLFLIKPRIPPHLQRISYSEKSRQNVSTTAFLKHHSTDPETLLYATANLLQGLAFPLPAIYLPTYARALNLPPRTGPLLLSALSLFQVYGQIALGHISDHVSPHIPPSISTLTSGFAVLYLLGPAGPHSLDALTGFSAVWGTFAASYSVLWTQVAAKLAKGDAEGTMALYALFSFERGVAMCVAGPLSAVLVGEGEPVIGEYGLGKYKGVVVMTGVLLLISSAGGIAWFWERGERRRKGGTAGVKYQRVGSVEG